MISVEQHPFHIHLGAFSGVKKVPKQLLSHFLQSLKTKAHLGRSDGAATIPNQVDHQQEQVLHKEQQVDHEQQVSDPELQQKQSSLAL